MGLRITGGMFKGRKLLAVRGRATRPTAERAREAIFNILAERVRSAKVLDLFAGTGTLGIEALSRGAEYAAFADISKAALRVLSKNIRSCHLENQTRTVQWDVLKNLNCFRSVQPPFTLVLMDPPYAQGMIRPTLLNLHASRCLASGARVMIEHCGLEAIPAALQPFRIADERKYGKTLVSFLDYML